MQLIKCNRNRMEMKHKLTIIKILEIREHARKLACRLDGVNKKLQC